MCSCGGARIDCALDYGSTVLSEDIHKENVARVLKLNQPMTELLRAEMSSDNIGDLERANREFAMVALWFKKIWSFLEGQQTTLTVSGTPPVQDDDDDTGAEADTTGRSPTFFQTPVSLISTVKNKANV